MAVVVVPLSGGSVLANSSSVCQFLVTEVRRATTCSLLAPSYITVDAIPQARLAKWWCWSV